MKDSMKIALGIIIGCGGIVALFTCCFSILAVVFGVTIFPSEVMASVSRHALGESTRYNNFEVTVIDFEFSDSYITKYQSTKDPPKGAKFAWIHIKVQNLGNTAERAPRPFEFKLIYQDDKIHGEGGSREGHPDYTGGFLTGEEVYPGSISGHDNRYGGPF